MRKLLIISVLLACVPALCRAQNQDAVNSQIYLRVASALQGREGLPPGDLMVEVAKQFEGTPYVGGSIEKSPENLVVCLDKTDCILFVEMCTAFVQTLKSSSPSYKSLCDNIRRLRYRNGQIDGYGSRLHYTSEWLQQASARRVLIEYTERLGTPSAQRFHYMTTHRSSYPGLADDQAYEAVRQAEARLNAAGPYYVVPAEELKSDISILSKIKDGDIICFVSGVDGLDISHVGIACKGDDSQMHFIHASSRRGKVVIESQTLIQYLSGGIRLARLL